ncbi:hypothetical protein LV89_04103 [Arcicella aurantiaca]|uniref:Uncharacterized protein n=1 Tax=Arcicella aurantiaca TaxID=591202 RepID=A0A316DJN8_9BACT|nr:DUF393 domain-containing protein [Arcicella aurantiaca]PWK18404.1 hypothetical protein LV89_04103 [Arcicella aurantiaca]
METLQNYKLLIDADCPMCRLYGNAFENNGLIDKGTSSPYQTVDLSVSNLVDMNRAKNEIAFVNTLNNEVVYGLDAFKIILSNAFPKLSAILNFKPIDWFGRKLYRFVSTNRKIIIPAKSSGNDCTPTLNVKYRIAYLLFVAVFSSLIIYNYSTSINQMMGWKSSIYRELIMCFGQIIWQTIFLNKILKTKFWDYIGNMMTVSMIGTILLLPMLIFNTSSIVHLVYFMMVVSVMLLEHLRRCKILEIGIMPTILWVAYRITFLLLIGLLQ